MVYDANDGWHFYWWKEPFLKQIERYFGKRGEVGNSRGKGIVSLALHTNLASYDPFGGATQFPKWHWSNSCVLWKLWWHAWSRLAWSFLTRQLTHKLCPCVVSPIFTNLPCGRVWELYSIVVSMMRSFFYRPTLNIQNEVVVFRGLLE